MSTATCPSAPVSCCISRRRRVVGLTAAAILALGAAAGGQPSPIPPAVTLLQMEVDLAARPQPYLVVHPEIPRLEIKVRGLVVERVPLLGAAVLRYRHPETGPSDPGSLPWLLRVQRRPPGTPRTHIAPPTLGPWAAAEEQEAPAVAAVDAGQSAPPPSRYAVPLDSNWELRVEPELPPEGIFVRWRETLEDGWRRFRGDDSRRPDLLVLALEADRAQSIHHLFREGASVVVAPEISTSQGGSPGG